jgi:SH3 domain-containing YSC84-like protein 1
VIARPARVLLAFRHDRRHFQEFLMRLPGNTTDLIAACTLVVLAFFAQAQVRAESDTRGQADETTYGTVDPPPEGADPAHHRTGDVPTGADPTPRRGDPHASGPGPSARSAEGPHRVFGSEREDLPEPERTVIEASDVLQQIRQDPDMVAALSQARGVFLIPGYATAALVVGGAGGSGVMLEHRDGEWSAPAFFNVGSVSLGLQAGVAVGPLVMLLMNEDAIRPFRDVSSFSLDAEAGLTILDWSAVEAATAGRGDVLIWSDMAGLAGDLSVAVTNVNYDEEHTSRYYGQQVISPQNVLAGEVEDPHGAPLQTEFAEFTGAR